MDAEARVTSNNVGGDLEPLSLFQETSDVVAVRGHQGYPHSKALSLRHPDSMQATRDRLAHYDRRLGQIEALQAQLTRQMQQVSKVGCETREFTLLVEELDRRVSAAEAKHTKLENRTASLSGNCSGLSAEMATQIRRIESLDTRFIDFKRHSQDDIKNSISELGQKLQQNLPPVNSNDCSLQISSSTLQEEVQRHTELFQTIESRIEERLSKQSMDLSNCFVGLNERCDLLMLELQSFREIGNDVGSNQGPHQPIPCESLENSKLSAAKLDVLEARFASLADQVSTHALKTEELLQGSMVDTHVAKLEARFADLADQVSTQALKTEDSLRCSTMDACVTKLDALEARFANLADQVSAQGLQSQELLKGSTLDACVSKLDTLEARFGKLSDRVSTHAGWTEELLSYDVCVKQHTSSLEELSAKQEKLDQRADKLDQRADEVIDSHRRTDADLTRLMNSFSQRHDDLRVMVIKLEENLKAEHERGLLIWKDYSIAMEGVDNLKKQLESGHDEMTKKIGSVESAIMEVHDSVGRASSDSASIQQDLLRHQAGTSAFREHISGRVDEIATELSRCKDAVSAVDQHVVSLRPEIEGVRMKIDNIAKSQRAEFEPLETSLAAFSQQLQFVEEACKEITNLKEKSVALEQSCHDDRVRISSLEQRIIEEMHLTEKLTGLEKKILDDVTAELVKSNAKVSIVDEAVETIKLEIAGIRETITSHTESQIVDASLASLSERVQSIEHACPEIETLKKKLGSLEQTHQLTETQTAELRSLEASLELASQQTQSHSDELKSLKESVTTLREQVRLVEHVCPAVENIKVTLRELSVPQTESHGADLKPLQASLASLSEQVQLIEQTCPEMLNLKEKLACLEAKLTSLEASLAKLSGQVQQSSPEIENLNEKLASPERASQQLLDASDKNPITDSQMAHLAAATFVSGIVRRYSEQSESSAFG